MYYIKPNPYVLNALKQVTLPISSIDEILRTDSNFVEVYSDYGPANSSYDTFAYYVTASDNSGVLGSILKQIKGKYGIPERTIDYKGRKDKLKKKAFLEWISFVRNHPGLIYIAAFDRRLERLIPTNEAKSFDAGLKMMGLQDKPIIYDRMAKVISFMAILGRYLEGKHRLAWITDDDCILDTYHRKNLLLNSLGLLANETLKEPISAFGFTPKFRQPEDAETKAVNEHFKSLLSIADIASSCLGASLQYDRLHRLRCPDDETIEIIQELSKFESIDNYHRGKQAHCALGISIFDLKTDEEDQPFFVPGTMQLEYDPSIDPLIRKESGIRSR